MHTKFLLLTAASMLGACASPPPSDFGASVRQMQDGQVYDRATLTQPSTAPVVGGDPDQINNAVTSMRSEKSSRESILQPMTISIGEGGR